TPFRSSGQPAELRHDTGGREPLHVETDVPPRPPATTTPPVQPPAYVVSKVTQASDGSGQVPFPVPVLDVNGNVVGTTNVNVGEYVHFGFQDNGNPPGQNPTGATPTTDMLTGVPASPEGRQGKTPTHHP